MWQEQQADTQLKADMAKEAILKARQDFKSAEESGLDFSDAKLSDVKVASDAFNANIVSMIQELDKTTSGIGISLDTLKKQTTLEKLIGVFSRNKASEMRADRISKSSVSDMLQDLITQSEGIITILKGQLEVLGGEIKISQQTLDECIKKRQEVIKAIEDTDAKMNDLDPFILKLESDLLASTTPSEKLAIEDEINKKNIEMNALKNENAELTAKSQSLDAYTKQNNVHLKSLNEQHTSQQILISKLELDTQQRVVLYKQYEESLKTADQQTAAHRISEIGTEMDKKTMEGMAHMGAASSNHIAKMMEDHEIHNQDRIKIIEAQGRANEQFNRRFADIVKKHNEMK